MTDRDAGLRAATAAILAVLPQAAKKGGGAEPADLAASLDLDLLARAAVAGWLAADKGLPAEAAFGTTMDWDPDWPVPPGWHVEIYPELPTDRATTRNDRMHAAARIIKE